MAKTPKLKANAQSKSPHSRAAKRAHSPWIDLDKSLVSASRPEKPGFAHPALLGALHGSGIIKKKPKAKQLTRAQKLRQAKGLERAEAVMDKTQSKAERSRKKGRNVKERSTSWDEVNGRIQERKKVANAAKDDQDLWEDVDIEKNAGTSDQNSDELPSVEGPTQLVVVDRTHKLEDEGEIT